MKNSMSKHALIAALALMLGVTAPSVSAASATIEQAKAQCVVGEQADGYLGVVTGANASDALRREVRDINQQRKTVYSSLARRNGVTVEVAAALTAEKLMNQASRGQCIKDQSGQWRKK